MFSETNISKSKVGDLEDLYPQILFKSMSLMFSFKARYSHYPSNEDDEKMFYHWEEICKIMYPGDWDVGDGYLF